MPTATLAERRPAPVAPMAVETRRRAHPRPVPGRPLVALALAGLLAAAGFVALYGRTHHVAGVQPPTTWFGLLSDPATPAARGAAAIGAWTAVGLLGCCWAVLLRLALEHRLRLRQAAGLAGLWAVPFAVGPPLTSLDLYAFAAEGSQLLAGQNPYTDGPSALGGGSALVAMDPRWRDAPSPYGSLGLALEWAASAVTGGTTLPTVLLLKAVCVLAGVAVVVLLAALAAPRDRAFVVVAVGCSPLLLVNATSAAHLEAPVLALLLAAVLLERRGASRWALLAALAAGLVKAPALLAVGFLVLAHLRGGGLRAVLRRDVPTLLAACAAVTALVPDAWGWVGTVLHTPAVSRAAWTPSTALAYATDAGWQLVGRSPGFDALLSVWRAAGFAAAAGLCAWLALRPRGPWWRQAGVALTGLALLGFIVFPWYLLWGVPLLVLALRRRGATVAAAGAAAFTVVYAMPELADWRDLATGLQSGQQRGAVTALAAAVVIGLGLSARVRRGLRRGLGALEPARPVARVVVLPLAVVPVEALPVGVEPEPAVAKALG